MAVKRTKKYLERHVAILEAHNHALKIMWEKEVARVKKLKKTNRQLRSSQAEIAESVRQLRHQVQSLMSASLRPWR